MVILDIIFLILFVAIGVAGVICIKIKMAGMEVKDFFKFIFAMNDLDDLYIYSNLNKNMTTREQDFFMKEAEKLFSIFDKIPSIIWEDEYDKYSKVLDTYKNIRAEKWAASC